MATTPGSAWTSCGWSGGAVGSSQSPNWKPVSQSPESRQQRLDPPEVREHGVDGLLEDLAVAVGLPQRPRNPDRGVAPDRGGLRGPALRAGSPSASGRRGPRTAPVQRRRVVRRRDRRANRAGIRPHRRGTRPSGRTRRCRRSNRGVHRAAGSRSGRPGSSRAWPIRHCAWSWLSRSWEQRNSPIRRSSECTTTAVTDAGVSSPGQPSIWTYRNPWTVMVGSKRSVGPGEDESVGGLRGAQGPRPQLPAVEHLGVADRDGGSSARRTTSNRTHPTRFCPKSTRVCPVGDCQTRCAAMSCCRRTGGPTYAVRVAASKSQRVDADPAIGGEPRRLPSSVVTSCVDGLAVVEIVGDHGGWAGAPCLVRDDGLLVAVVEVDLQLGEGAELGSVDLAFPRPSQAPSEPPVAQLQPQDDAIGTRVSEQAGDVVAAVPEPPLVAAPARGEHVIAHRRPVDRGRDDAARCRVQDGPRDATVALIQGELATEDRRSGELLVGRDHLRGPAHRVRCVAQTSSASVPVIVKLARNRSRSRELRPTSRWKVPGSTTRWPAGVDDAASARRGR